MPWGPVQFALLSLTLFCSQVCESFLKVNFADFESQGLEHAYSGRVHFLEFIPWTWSWEPMIGLRF